MKDDASAQQKTQKPQQNQSAVNQVLMAKQRADIAQKELAMKQRMAAQKGVNLTSLSASYEPDGDQIDEKITVKTDMGAAIRDFQLSKSEQLAGRTKEQRRKAAIAAVLTARRGGKKLGEEVKKEKDPREIPTEIDLVKARLRAKGIKVSGITPSPRNTETVELPPIGEQMTTQTQFKPLPSSGSTGTSTPPPAPQLHDPLS